MLELWWKRGKIQNGGCCRGGERDAAGSRNGCGCWRGRESRSGWVGPAGAVPVFGHEEAGRPSVGDSQLEPVLALVSL